MANKSENSNKPKGEKPHPSEVRYVFLDTQVFRTNQYDLHSKNLQKLASLAESGKLKLVSTDLTMREIMSHLAHRAGDAEAAIKKVQKELLPLVRTTNKLIAPLMKDYKAKDFVAALESEVRHYFDRCKVEVVPISEQDLGEVLDLHFSKRPPFDSKKPSEFKDAFVMLALKSWSERFLKRTIHVVSGDGDWGGVCHAHSMFREWKTLPEILSLFPDQKLAAAIEKGFDRHKKFVQDMLAIKFPDLNFYLDQAAGEISKIQVLSVTIERVYVVEADAGKGRVDVECHVRFSCEATYDRPGTNHYDHQGRCNVYPEREWAKYESGEFLMAEIEIGWNPRKPSDVSIEDQKFKDQDIFIDLDDILKSER